MVQRFSIVYRSDLPENIYSYLICLEMLTSLFYFGTGGILMIPIQENMVDFTITHSTIQQITSSQLQFCEVLHYYGDEAYRKPGLLCTGSQMFNDTFVPRI